MSSDVLDSFTLVIDDPLILQAVPIFLRRSQRHAPLLSAGLLVGILLSVLGHLVLNEFFGGIPMQFAVSVAGVAIMISVAALMEWFAAAQGTPGGGALGAPTAGRGARG